MTSAASRLRVTEEDGITRIEFVDRNILDEANIQRFLKFLHKLKAKTQFLIITHNKLTMSRSDSLIGITMQEKGISKTIAVDLHKEDGE